jgi:hypothetical protein
MSSGVRHPVFQEALRAAAHGPFFPEREFQTLIGFDRAAVAAAAASFPPAIPVSGDLALMLNNCMNNLLGYPHGEDSAWSQWLSVTPRELGLVFSQWLASGVEF